MACQPAGTPAGSGSTGTSTVDGPVEGAATSPGRTTAAGTAMYLSARDTESLPACVYHNGMSRGQFAILESLGGGVGTIDFDRDGWLDLILPSGGDFQDTRPTGRGLSCLQNRHGRFVPRAEESRLALPAFYNHGVAATDVDHDGFDDLLITGFGGLQLLLNAGDGTFHPAASDNGLVDRSWSSSAAWADFNLDTHPDLYVTHYVNWSPENNPECFATGSRGRDVCSPRQFEGLPDQLFLSHGDGSFADATEPFQLADGGKGLAVLAADIDLDGDTDVYVANDTVANFLYLNDGGRRFTDISQISGSSVSDTGTPDGSMSIDLGDYNLDGRPDLWVSNFERETFALYRNQTGTFFRHVSDVTGVHAVSGRYVGWGAVFADLDLDGDEDVLAANGHVVYHPDYAPVLQRMLLFENIQGTHFQEVAEASPDLSVPGNRRGLVVADLNRDGLPDAVVSEVNHPASVFDNRSVVAGGFLQLSLTGRRSSRTPVGARVQLTTSAGIQSRQVRGGGSYASTFADVIHFGIPAGATIQSVQVFWPGGVQQQLNDLQPGQHYRIIEPREGSVEMPVFDVIE